jgi:putative ABC transport system permease protein
VLVTLQVAVVVVLLIGAGLVVRSFINLRQTDLGFSPSGVVALNVTASGTPGPPNVWVASLLDRLRTLPSVQSAGAVFLRPLAHGPIGQESWVFLEGQQADRDPLPQNPTLNYEVATPSYFETMRIPLRRGRVFDRVDIDHARPVAVVSASTAERLWPNHDPVGKRLLLPTFSPRGPDRMWRTVVGVVATVRYRGLDDGRFDVYVPASAGAQTTSDVVVRGAGDLSVLARTIQTEIRRIDPEAVVDAVASMEDVVRRAMAPWALGAWMFSVFALLALVLAAVGLVGLVSLDVVQRHHEFAVRLAVGADRVDILRRVFRRAAWMVGIGTGAGLFAATVSSRVLQSVLYGVDAFDPATYLTVSIVIAIVAAAAAFGPARRAANTNPMTLLRGD